MRSRNFSVYFLAFFMIIPLTLFCAEEKKDSEKQINDIETRLEYARVLSYMKKYDESVQEYQKVLKDNPNLVEAKVELAKVYYYQGKYTEALQGINALPKNEKTAEIEFLLADIYLVQKDYTEAEEIYKKLLTELPDKNDIILLKLAEIYSWQKKYPESLSIYEELVNKHPNDIQLQRKYAMVLMWSGKQKEAAEILKRTLN